MLKRIVKKSSEEVIIFTFQKSLDIATKRELGDRALFDLRRYFVSCNPAA